ncbi:hypothetical protein ACKUZF_008090 [Proteus mirabilis]
MPSLKIDPNAIETIKEKAKAIDDLARANSVAQFAYDRGKEIEQMQFETTLIGKSRAEQEKLNALRQRLMCCISKPQCGFSGEKESLHSELLQMCNALNSLNSRLRKN